MVNFIVKGKLWVFKLFHDEQNKQRVVTDIG